MNGVFYERPKSWFHDIVGICLGLALFIGFIRLLIIDKNATIDDKIIALFFAGFGLLIVFFRIATRIINRKAYINITKKGISAFCHFGLSLNCEFSDIESVSYGGSVLTINLKNGRKYSVSYLENDFELCKYIQKRIGTNNEEYFSKELLQEEVYSLKKKRKLFSIASIGSFCLIFPDVLITAILTDGKDISDFDTEDKFVFRLMLILGVSILIVFSVIFKKFLSQNEVLEKKENLLKLLVIKTTKSQPGNPIKLFVDDEFYPTGRIVVYGYPNSDDVYFIGELLNDNYELDVVYESPIFKNMGDLLEEIGEKIEIEFTQIDKR